MAGSDGCLSSRLSLPVRPPSSRKRLHLKFPIASTEKEIKCQKGKAWSTFWKLDRVWKSSVSLQQKIQLFFHPTYVVKLIPSKRLALESYLAFLVLITLATRKSKIEREQSLFPNQLLKARQIRFLGHCLRHPQGDLISKYALYHPTHGKPRSGGRKILFHEHAAKLINPETPPFLTKIVLWHRTAKLGSTWRSAADTTGNPP